MSRNDHTIRELFERYWVEELGNASPIRFRGGYTNNVTTSCWSLFLAGFKTGNVLTDVNHQVIHNSFSGHILKKREVIVEYVDGKYTRPSVRFWFKIFSAGATFGLAHKQPVE